MPLREALAPLSPGRRRWERFLDSLTLDPDQLPRPLDPPGSNDFIICGSPRTGTTLLCAALFQPPKVITVMEPWDGMRIPPAPLFASLRRELAEKGRLSRGRLDVDSLMEQGATRWWREGSATPPLDTTPELLVGVKWPAYWRFLDLLPETKFLVCLRHPFETVASFKQVGGRLSEGLEYKTAFNAALNSALRSATSDRALRRILLYDYINSRILPHLDNPNVFAVRYERWFSDAKGLMHDIGAFLGVDVMATPVRIRERGNGSSLSSRELALIRTTCTTADRLAYSLDPPPQG